AAPERRHGAAVPGGRVEELHQGPIRAAARPGHPGDAARTGPLAVDLEAGVVTPAVPEAPPAPPGLARSLSENLDDAGAPEQPAPRPPPRRLTRPPEEQNQRQRDDRRFVWTGDAAAAHRANLSRITSRAPPCVYSPFRARS